MVDSGSFKNFFFSFRIVIKNLTYTKSNKKKTLFINQKKKNYKILPFPFMSFYILKLLYDSLIINAVSCKFIILYFIVEQFLSAITVATRRAKLTFKANRIMDI